MFKFTVLLICMFLLSGCHQKNVLLEQSLNNPGESNLQEESRSEISELEGSESCSECHSQSTASSQSESENETSSASESSDSFEEVKSWSEYSDDEFLSYLKIALSPIFDAAQFGTIDDFMTSLAKQNVMVSDSSRPVIDQFFKRLSYMRGEVYASKVVDSRIENRSGHAVTVQFTIKRAFSPAGNDPNDTAHYLYTLLDNEEGYEKQLTIECAVTGQQLRIEIPQIRWWE